MANKLAIRFLFSTKMQNTFSRELSIKTQIAQNFLDISHIPRPIPTAGVKKMESKPNLKFYKLPTLIPCDNEEQWSLFDIYREKNIKIS